MKPPVIIIGMHRSGTTMLVSILQKLGYFMGLDLDDNLESRFFANINNWIFRNEGLRWDDPVKCEEMKESKLFELYRERVDYYINSPRLHSYIGMRRRSFLNSSLWGWKDPRNTFTIDLWMRLFPGAKIISIKRHGVDVAESLKVREERYLTRKNKIVPGEWLNPRLPELIDSRRCLSLEGGMLLWKMYNEKINRIEYPILHLYYEDFAKSPHQVVESISDFLETSIVAHRLIDIIGSIKAERMFAFKLNSHLMEFAIRNENELNIFGYTSEGRVE